MDTPGRILYQRVACGYRFAGLQLLGAGDDNWNTRRSPQTLRGEPEPQYAHDLLIAEAV
jgi:hypothetical protein